MDNWRVDRTAASDWDSLSSAFRRFRPPLTPSAQDIEWYQERARTFTGEAPRALLFGVTPGIAAMQWPRGTTVVAVDWSGLMIRNVWPGRIVSAFANAVRADWRELPLAAGSCHVAFCDLFFPALPSSEDAALVLGEAHRILRKSGRLFMRAFIRPEPEETIDELLAELLGGRTDDMLLFRWRLAAAAQASFRVGVEASEVWALWRQRIPDAASLGKRLPHIARDIDSIERWKDMKLRFGFPSLAEVKELIAPRFELLDYSLPDYGCARRIARIALRAL